VELQGRFIFWPVDRERGKAKNQMGDPGKVIAGILKGKMKDATYLERLAEERMTHDAAASQAGGAHDAR
jgi:hypothetical protein